jgi:hypothetical protein
MVVGYVALSGRMKMHRVVWYVLIAVLPHIFLEGLRKTIKYFKVIASEREVSRYRLPGLGGLEGTRGPNMLHTFLSVLVVSKFADCAI